MPGADRREAADQLGRPADPGGRSRRAGSSCCARCRTWPAVARARAVAGSWPPRLRSRCSAASRPGRSPAIVARSSHRPDRGALARRVRSRGAQLLRLSAHPTRPRSRPRSRSCRARVEDRPARSRRVRGSPRLREEFAATLVRLGDEYWERDGGKPFAIDYYAEALVFTPDDAHAASRAILTPGQLALLRHKAETRGVLGGRAGRRRAPDRARRSRIPSSARRRSPSCARHRVHARRRPTRASPSCRRHRRARARRSARPRATPRSRPRPALPPSHRPRSPRPRPASRARTDTARRRCRMRRPMRRPRSRRRRRFGIRRRPPRWSPTATVRVMPVDSATHARPSSGARARQPLARRDDRPLRRRVPLRQLRARGHLCKKGRPPGPAHADYRIRLGDAYFKAFRYQDARREYTTAQTLGSTAAAARLAKVDAKLR